jgi:hypothetical protein
MKHGGETHKSENYTINRQFGKVTFSLADAVDKLAVSRKLIGEPGDDVLPADSILHDCAAHPTQASTTGGFVALDTQYLYSAGALCVIINEHILAENTQARAVFDGFIEKLRELIDCSAIIES